MIGSDYAALLSSSLWLYQILIIIRWENPVLFGVGRGQACKTTLSGSCQILWFKILALDADGPGLPLQDYGMKAGKAGGYIPTHRLEVLA